MPNASSNLVLIETLQSKQVVDTASISSNLAAILTPTEIATVRSLVSTQRADRTATPAKANS
jgi:hypothetical protein